MEEPLPIIIVFHLYQSKGQRNQPVVGIIGYCNQDSALELTGQKGAINGDDRPTMFKCLNTLLESPKCTAKNSNGSFVYNPCLVPQRFNHMNHARVNIGHRSQQPWDSVIKFLPITVQHLECGLLSLPCLPVLHLVVKEGFHKLHDLLDSHYWKRRDVIGKPISEELGGELSVL